MTPPRSAEDTRRESDEAEQTAPLPLRRLFALARPEAPRLVAGTLALLIASGMALLFPVAMGEVVDAAVSAADSGDTSLLDRWAWILAGAIVLQSLFVFLRYYLYAIAGERIVCDLRGSVYEAILSQEVAFFDGEGTGQLQSRLSSDTGQIQGAVTEDLGALLSDVVRVLLGLGMLAWYSPELTLWMVGTVPPIAVAAVLFGRRISKLSKKVQEALASAGDVVQESISSVRTVRSFGAEKREIGRYREAIEKVFEVSRKQTIAVSRFGGGAWMAGVGAVARVFWFGGRR
ncbi:MAG: ABC transporter transmembrane domain-containing protein, partial [Planctomycetota bacterium]